MTQIDEEYRYPKRTKEQEVEYSLAQIELLIGHYEEMAADAKVITQAVGLNGKTKEEMTRFDFNAVGTLNLLFAERDRLQSVIDYWLANPEGEEAR